MEHSQHQHHHRQHHDSQHEGPDADIDWPAMAELLDLDAVVLHTYLSDLTAWVRRMAADTPRRRILDLGAGTGTATIALAQWFGGADVIAVDGSEQLLARIRAKALDLGLAGRVATVEADLDVAWPAIGAVDVTWASMSLHHMADPGRVLGEVFAATHPGGLLAVAELDAPLRFLPDDIGLGRPGLESRCQAAADGSLAHSAPHLGSDWGQRLEQAGFIVAAKRVFDIDLTAPHSVATRRYARGSLLRIRSMVEDRMAAADLAALDTLLDSDGPDSLLYRDDLTVRGTRTAWIARRPPAADSRSRTATRSDSGQRRDE